MEFANEQFEAAYTLDQVIEFAESTNDDTISLEEGFDDETDAWARRALAANEFGDYC